MDVLKVKVTRRIDGWKMPDIHTSSPELAKLLSSLDSAICAVRDGRVGPYGAIESIITALEDYADPD